MPILKSFPNLPIVRRIAALFTKQVGSNAQDAPPVGTPTKYSEDTPIVGSTVASPWLDRINQDFVEPQQQLEKYIAGDLALAINPTLNSAFNNYTYGAAGVFQGITIIDAPNVNEAQTAVDEFVEATQLKVFLPEITKHFALYGNGYLQHEVERLSATKAAVVGLIWMPPYGMIRRSNQLDKFDNPSLAFKQVDIALGIYLNQDAGVDLPEWAINHMRLYFLKGQRYGKSLIASTIYSGANKRAVDAALEIYWNRRFSRVTDAHQLVGPEGMPIGDTQLKDHMARTAKARLMQDGKEPPRDLYLPNGTIQRLNSDPNTDKTEDVELLIAIALAELKHSLGMISDDKFANVGVVEDRFRQLYMAEEQLILAECEQLRPSVNLNFALRGIDPKAVKYRFNFGQLLIQQDMALMMDKAGAAYDKHRLDTPTYAKVAGMYFREDPKVIQDNLEKEQAERDKKQKDLFAQQGTQGTQPAAGSSPAGKSGKPVDNKQAALSQQQVSQEEKTILQADDDLTDSKFSN